MIVEEMLDRIPFLVLLDVHQLEMKNVMMGDIVRMEHNVLVV